MKKALLSIVILSSGFLNAGAQFMQIRNMTSCTVSFAIHAQDSGPYSICTQLTSNQITLTAGQSLFFSDVTALNACPPASAFWPQVCASGVPAVAPGTWDEIDQLSGFSTIFGTSLCIGRPLVTSVPGCPGATARWNALPGGNVDVLFN